MNLGLWGSISPKTILGAIRRGASGPSDTTRPTVAITSASSGTTAGAFTCTFTFSEDVTGFAVGDITCSANAGAGTFNAVSGSVYTAVITPTAIGTVTVDVAEGVAQDAAANTNTAAPQFSIVSTSIAAPAITPTLGSEVLTNAGFEGTYDDESGGGGGTVNVAPGWNMLSIETDGTDTLDKETTIIHGGSAAQKAITNSGSEGVTTSTAPFVSVGWYQASLWTYLASGHAGITMSDTNSNIDGRNFTTGSWVQIIATGRTASANRNLNIIGSGTAYFDDASVKAITLSSMLSSVGALTGRDGTYTCHPTVAASTQAGMAIAYLNATNFVLAVVYHTALAATAKLFKYVLGTWTEVITGTITYGAATELKVIISGTSYALYYNNVQVGTTQTISDTLGDEVYAFNSYPGNTVGNITANP